MIKSPWFFLIFGALFPVLFLFAQNANELSGNEIWRALGVTVVVAVLLTFLLHYIYRSLSKSALVVLLGIFLFFSYGRMYQIILSLGGFTVEDFSYLWLGFVLFFGLLLGGVAVWLRSIKSIPIQFIKTLNIITLLLVVFQLVTAVPVVFGRMGTAEHSVETLKPEGGGQVIENPRDIYYLILDGYARADVMRELYGYDNSAFLAGLDSLGFYIADSARSNYCHTFLSLASSMNLDYIANIGHFDELLHDRMPVGQRLLHNALVDKLHGYGYTFVSFASGLNYTEFEDADYYLSSSGGLNDFEQTLMSQTPLSIMLNVEKDQYDMHRDRIGTVLDKMGDLGGITAPKFVFAHIIGPHPPFVFDRVGNALKAVRPYTKADGNDFVRHGGSKAEYIQQYRDEAIYLSQQIRVLVEKILSSYPEGDKPIIIVQADHGPGSQTHWHLIEQTNMWERMSILNAYYFPDDDYALMYRSITPVNSFRMVLRKYFNEDWPLLPDSVFFSTFNYPYGFYEVSDRVVRDRGKP